MSSSISNVVLFGGLVAMGYFAYTEYLQNQNPKPLHPPIKPHDPAIPPNVVEEPIISCEELWGTAFNRKIPDRIRPCQSVTIMMP